MSAGNYSNMTSPRTSRMKDPVGNLRIYDQYDYNLSQTKQEQEQEKEDCNCCDVCCCIKYSLCSLISVVFGALVTFLVFHHLEGKYTPYTPSSGNNTNTTNYGCSHASDVQILLNLGSSLRTKIHSCVEVHEKDHNKKVLPCIQQSTGLSEQCIYPFLEQTQCGKKYCLLVCIANGGMDSPKCRDCICSHCRKTFVDETKIPCTLLPEGIHTCGDCPAHAPYVPPVTPAPAASVVSL